MRMTIRMLLQKNAAQASFWGKTTQKTAKMSPVSANRRPAGPDA
jgi:hypothetical protein